MHIVRINKITHDIHQSRIRKIGATRFKRRVLLVAIQDFVNPEYKPLIRI